MQTLMQGIYERWNAAGLDTSIAELYPAGETPSKTRNRAGSPVKTTVPRAEYFVSVAPVQAKSRNSRLRQAVATLQVWRPRAALAGSDVASIYTAFVNSDAAGTDPLAMSDADVLEVDDGGSTVFKEDDGVFQGVQQLIIRFRMDNETPA